MKSNFIKITLVVIVFIYCNKSNRTNRLHHFKDALDIDYKDQNISGQSENDLQNRKRKVLIVIIQGLQGKKSSNLSREESLFIKKSLLERYPDSPLDFLIITSQGTNDITLEDQSKFVHNEILKLYKSSNIDYNIIFIGKCTGGLVAYEVYRSYNKEHKICGILTAMTPWLGIDLLNSKYKISKNIYNVFLYPIIYSVGQRKPLKELYPQSIYLTGIKKSLESCKIPIWAVGGKTNFYRAVLDTKIQKAIFKKSITEKDIFGSYEHDGVCSLHSQIAYGNAKINSIALEEPSSHSLAVKDGIINFFTIFTKTLSPFISCEDKKKLLSNKNEPSVVVTRSFICLACKFVEKYGLSNNKTYPSDTDIINNCVIKKKNPTSNCVQKSSIKIEQ